MNTKTAITILAALLLASSPAHAQRIRGFISSGATLSQIEGDELKGFRKLGYTGGVGAIVALDRHEDWRISVEALFSQRGTYNASSEPYAAVIPLNYVDIPLMLHYRDPWGGMLVGLGATYGRLTEQPRGIIEYQSSFFPDTNDLKFLRNDLAIVADIRFTVWRGLMLNIRWQYSLLAIKRDWNFYQRDGETILYDDDGIPIFDENGKPQIVPRYDIWANNCYSNSLSFRLIWQF